MEDRYKEVICYEIHGHMLKILNSVTDCGDAFVVMFDDIRISDPYNHVSFDIANSIYAASKIILVEVLVC